MKMVSNIPEEEMHIRKEKTIIAVSL